MLLALPGRIEDGRVGVKQSVESIGIGVCRQKGIGSNWNHSTTQSSTLRKRGSSSAASTRILAEALSLPGGRRPRRAPEPATSLRPARAPRQRRERIGGGLRFDPVASRTWRIAFVAVAPAASASARAARTLVVEVADPLERLERLARPRRGYPRPHEPRVELAPGAVVGPQRPSREVDRRAHGCQRLPGPAPPRSLVFTSSRTGSASGTSPCGRSRAEITCSGGACAWIFWRMA